MIVFCWPRVNLHLHSTHNKTLAWPIRVHWSKENDTQKFCVIRIAWPVEHSAYIIAEQNTSRIVLMTTIIHMMITQLVNKNRTSKRNVFIYVFGLCRSHFAKSINLLIHTITVSLYKNERRVLKRSNWYCLKLVLLVLRSQFLNQCSLSGGLSDKSGFKCVANFFLSMWSLLFVRFSFDFNLITFNTTTNRFVLSNSKLEAILCLYHLFNQIYFC